MIDESMDTEQMQHNNATVGVPAKPAWQRLLIMVGGVLFNFILALFIYSMILLLGEMNTYRYKKPRWVWNSTETAKLSVSVTVTY